MDVDQKFDDLNVSNKPNIRFDGFVKVCGMKYPPNMNEVASLQPDFMGFVFYPKSPRFVNTLDPKSLKSLPAAIKKIGVFVNEDVDLILTTTHKYQLDGVQLHGSENVELCKQLKETNLIVIKAFSIEAAYNFKVTHHYEDVCDFFLFDTKTQTHGGSGQQFDWNLLNEYSGNKPFFLSGGISAFDVQSVSVIKHPKFIGIDLNSKFEIEPGLKNTHLLQEFLINLKQ